MGVPRKEYRSDHSAAYMKKVVVFKQSSIGDCLMAKYLLDNVRAAYPDAQCAIVVGGRSAMLRDALAAYPWIPVLEANRRNFGSLVRLWQRCAGADLVVLPYTGGTVGVGTKLMARLLAYRGTVVGYSDRSSLTKLFCTTVIPLDGKRIAPRLLEQQALRAAGVPVAVPRPTYEYQPQPEVWSRFGVEPGRYVVVHLFSGAITRGLSPERQQELLDALSRTMPNLPLLLTGTERERAVLAQLRLPPQAQLIATTVQEAAALLDRASVMVSVGTGVSHIAACLHVPLAVMVNCQGVQWVGQEQWGDAPIKVFCNPAACPKGHDFSGYAACIESVSMPAIADAAKTLQRHI